MLSEPLPVVREVLLLGTTLAGVGAGVTVSATTIAAAWFVYHPLITVLVAGTAGSLWYLRLHPSALRSLLGQE